MQQKKLRCLITLIANSFDIREQYFDSDTLLSRKAFLLLHDRNVFKTVHPNDITINWSDVNNFCLGEFNDFSILVNQE
jgi:hypothetical protein